MDPNQSSSSKADRKTIEKNRRTHMKGLYTELGSLIPRQNHRLDQAKSLTDQLDEAEKYIKKLQGKLEKMKEKRERLMRDNPNARLYGGLATRAQIEIHESGDALVLCLMRLFECVMKEGLDIINASFSVTENSVFHTIHSKVGEYAEEGAISRATEKLNTFVAGST
ncbi:hypothetical protein DCAR_0728590 [Daucus carota subsp. sativus]|uniref:BHLH domain-containing protein n=1 Tax=Daucus carota subsp. sativus TaxID=79200 RepID=A0AAF0XJA1_DAUCS|nr:hypothetical protein DCAR_0728590 [Daucus carota subsp. sativus]